MSSKGAQVTTTLKLEQCSFSDMRIYPGRGTVSISRDGKSHIFSHSKVAKLYHQRIKPVKLRWTQAWRRANKKAVAQTGIGKKRGKATVKTQKAILGLSLEDLQKKRALAAQSRPAERVIAGGKKKGTKE